MICKTKCNSVEGVLVRVRRVLLLMLLRNMLMRLIVCLCVRLIFREIPSLIFMIRRVLLGGRSLSRVRRLLSGMLVSRLFLVIRMIIRGLSR